MMRILRRTEMLIHSVIIALLLWKGIILYVSGMHFPALLILGLSLTAMVITLYWKKFKLAPRQARQACYYIEGPIFLILYIICTSQEHNLAQAFLMAAIVFPFIGFATALKISKKKVLRD